MHEPVPSPSPDRLADLASEVFDRDVRPLLKPEDEGKFVAIDVESGACKLDEDDHAAVSRLRLRSPGAQVWLVRAGYPAAHQLRRGR